MTLRSDFMRAVRREFPHCAFNNGTTVRVMPREGNTAELVFIHLPRKKSDQGLGSEALDALCHVADEHDVTLTCSPTPSDDGGLGYGELIEWYGRRGFKPDTPGKHEHERLIRRSGASPATFQELFG